MGTFLGGLLLLPLQGATVLAVGGLLRRLVGVRISALRMVLAALLALAIARRVLLATVGPAGAVDGGSAFLLLVLAACAGGLAAMAVVVVAEVLVPERSVPGPVELWRDWRGRRERTRRYAQILRIAVRHGLGRFLRGRRLRGVDSPTARRQLAGSLRRALDEGGTTFVKLGQQLSTRRDLLPAELVDELTRLQDGAAAVPWPVVEATLEAELGHPLHDVFEVFDPDPIATASIAQVHGARLRGGAQVVVKVQRPGITQAIERDLDILRRLAGTLESRTTWGRRIGLGALAAGFATALREELDFTTELDNMRQLAAALNGAGRGVRIPSPDVGLSTRRVLVMERMKGAPLGSSPSLLADLGPEARRRAATALVDTVLDQLLDHGVFHVDLHPGNVLLRTDGSLELLDFGSVGRLDSTTRTAVGRFLASVGRGDSLAATDALLDLVDRPDEVDERELERAVGQLVVRYGVPGGRAGAAAFTALFRLTRDHHLRIPPEVAAVFRTFATLEGTLTLLDPDFDLLAHARQSGRDRMGQAVRPRQLGRAVEDEVLSLLPALRRFPRRVDRLLDSLEHGRLNTNTRLLADARDRRWITGLVHQLLLTALAGSAGLMAALLLAAGSGPPAASSATGSVGLFDLLGYGLLVVAGVLGLRVLLVVFREARP